jgi:hypothetical protein
MQHEELAVKRRVTEEQHFQRETENVVIQLGGGLPSELVVAPSSRSLYEEFNANVPMETPQWNNPLEERQIVHYEREECYHRHHQNEIIPTPLDHTEEQQIYAEEDRRRQQQLRSCWNRCWNKMLPLREGGGGGVILFIILMIFLIVMVISITTVTTVIILRNKQSHFMEDDTLCSLNRKRMFQCPSDFLEVPICAQDKFSQMIQDYLPNKYDTMTLPYTNYPCDTIHYSLLTIVVAQMNWRGPIPNMEQYKTLTILYYSLGGPDWYIDKNWFTGKSPCFSIGWYGISSSSSSSSLSCTENQYSIDAIELISNNLIGSFPTEITYLDSLQILKLNGGDITGTIPSDIGTLQHLSILNLADTRISGTIPTEIGLCQDMKEFNLVGPRIKISGIIPTEIGLLSSLGMSSMRVYKWIENCCIFVLMVVTNSTAFLGLSSDLLTGTIPNEFGSLSRLTELVLHNVPNLHGNLPSKFVHLSSLTKLYISNAMNTDIHFSSFLSHIPRSLQSLDVISSNFHGTIPTTISELQHLTHLRLSQLQHMTGTLPTEIGQMTRLESLELDDNDDTSFVGTIPTEFGLLTQLTLLNVCDSNLETEQLPSEVTQLPGLQIIPCYR